MWKIHVSCEWVQVCPLRFARNVDHAISWTDRRAYLAFTLLLISVVNRLLQSTWTGLHLVQCKSTYQNILIILAIFVSLIQSWWSNCAIVGASRCNLIISSSLFEENNVNHHWAFCLFVVLDIPRCSKISRDHTRNDMECRFHAIVLALFTMKGHVLYLGIRVTFNGGCEIYCKRSCLKCARRAPKPCRQCNAISHLLDLRAEHSSRQ